jgi:uncharacterized MAPEG superfamily protein
LTDTPELHDLILITAATGLMWVPYVTTRLTRRGLGPLANVDLGAATDPPWADRARRAHANATENLVVFAPLLLAGAVMGISTPTTILASHIYVAARLAHYVIFTGGIPLARTAAFLIGSLACLVIALTLLFHLA